MRNGLSAIFVVLTTVGLISCVTDRPSETKPTLAGVNGSGLDEKGVRIDYRPFVGLGLQVVATQPLRVVPSKFDSIQAGRQFTPNAPLILQPGDAFALISQEDSRLLLRFDYPEIVSGWVDVHQFPSGSLKVIVPSSDPRDEQLSSIANPKKPLGPHAIGTACALNPFRPGCTLAAVKYKLRDMKIVRPDFSNFPPKWQDVGCDAAHRPTIGLVCTYRSAEQGTKVKTNDRHVEIFDGEGWYFGLGHVSLQNDGHHTCVDCRAVR